MDCNQQEFDIFIIQFTGSLISEYHKVTHFEHKVFVNVCRSLKILILRTVRLTSRIAYIYTSHLSLKPN